MRITETLRDNRTGGTVTHTDEFDNELDALVFISNCWRQEKWRADARPNFRRFRLMSITIEDFSDEN